MFGYIRTFNDELKIKDYNIYRFYYCELCRNMGSFSELTRLFHSYDPVFYYMLCSNEEVPLSFCKTKMKCFRCRSRRGSKNGSFFAALSIVLIYHKFDNDVIDGDTKKRFLRRMVKRGYIKTLALYPHIGNTMNNGMKQLLEYEKTGCSDYAFLSDFFGNIVSDAVAFCMDRSAENLCRIEIIKELSACVYLIDILDDAIKDSISGDFNPLNLICGGKATRDGADSLKSLVVQKLGNIDVMLDLLPYCDNMAVLQNIIRYGIPYRLETVYNNFKEVLNKKR